MNNCIKSVKKKKNRQSVILIGRINKGKNPIGGETAKNQSLIAELEKYCKVYACDFYQNKKRPWVYIQTLAFILLFPSAPIILATTASNIYNVIRVFCLLHSKRIIIHWIIGGVFDKLVMNETFKATYFDNITFNLAESKSMVANLKKNGVKNALYVPNFRQIKYFPNIEKRLRFLGRQTKVHFVFVSRIMRVKGVDVILDAVNILNNGGLSSKYSVDFYGNVDPDYSSDFYTRVSDSENVRYCGFLNLLKRDGYDSLTSYHCMIFPTYHESEGFAGTLIDAFIAGLPIIASDWAHNAEIIKDNTTGIIIPSKNPIALANTMERIINGKVDICGMSRNAQKEALLYDAQNVVTESFLKQIKLLQ